MGFGTHLFSSEADDCCSWWGDAAAPRCSHQAEASARLNRGMVLTIGNCGIHREDFGVRMEDTVWVSDQGPVPLTHYPKTLAG